MSPTSPKDFAIYLKYPEQNWDLQPPSPPPSSPSPCHSVFRCLASAEFLIFKPPPCQHVRDSHFTGRSFWPKVSPSFRAAHAWDNPVEMEILLGLCLSSPSPCEFPPGSSSPPPQALGVQTPLLPGLLSSRCLYTRCSAGSALRAAAQQLAFSNHTQASLPGAGSFHFSETLSALP